MLRRSTTEATGGILGQYGLIDWWHATFPDPTRKYIDEVYKRSAKTAVGLTQGGRVTTKDNAGTFLNALAGYFMKSRNDRRFAYLMLKKAEALSERAEDVLCLHKTYTAMIRLHSEDLPRDPSAQASLEAACAKHVAMGAAAAKLFRNLRPDVPLPRHAGFETLAVIREKQEQYDEAVELCKQALAQGWSGCYERHMQRCEEKRSGVSVEAPKDAASGCEGDEEEPYCFDCAVRLAETHLSMSGGVPDIPHLVDGVCPQCRSTHSLDASELEG